MPGGRTRSIQDLSSEERTQLRRAHEHLRTASQELQSLIATEPIKNRWEPEPPPDEILQAARTALQEAFETVGRCHREVLGWDG